jgi:lysophospholipase L1-like esterase
MSRRSHGFSMFFLGRALLVAALLPAACAAEETPDSDDATGGSSATGGTGGVGAAGGTGGAGGTAGAALGGAGGATGGSGGVGGSVGGTAGTGGSAAGASASGGTMAGAAGSSGSIGNGGVAGNGAGAGMSGDAGAAGTMSGAGGMAGASGSAGAAGAMAGASGSAGSAGAAGGSGGASGFMPCPASGACKILPLGDSITDGLGVTGGGCYRIELFSLALENDKDITFVGGSMNGPQMVDGQPFPRAHEGHSGWTVSQIDGIVPSPALDPDPHIILLHIGTNDMYQGAAGATDRLETLVDQILADLPDSLLVVSTIIPFPGSSSNVSTFNAAVPGIVQERADSGEHIVFVDQFEGFPTSELADGVHPNATGYARMANKWWGAIEEYLP